MTARRAIEGAGISPAQGGPAVATAAATGGAGPGERGQAVERVVQGCKAVRNAGRRMGQGAHAFACRSGEGRRAAHASPAPRTLATSPM